MKMRATVSPGGEASRRAQ